MLGEKINIVLLLESVSFALVAFCALVLYLGARKIADIMRHQRNWVQQNSGKEVPMQLAGFAAFFWLIISTSSFAGLWVFSYNAEVLFGSKETGEFSLVVAVIVGLLSVCAGVRDAGAKSREYLWNYVARATHINTTEDFQDARGVAVAAKSGAQ